LLPAGDVGEEAIDLVHGAVAVVDVVARRRRRTDTGERFHDGVDGRVAVERFPTPGRREVAPLHQLPPRTAESRPGAVLRPSAANLLAQRTPHTRAGLGELALKPAIEDAAEQASCDVLGRDLELRIDPGLHRPLAEQLGAERVDGADAGHLELRERA